MKGGGDGGRLFMQPHTQAGRQAQQKEAHLEDRARMEERVVEEKKEEYEEGPEEDEGSRPEVLSRGKK